MKKWEYTSLFVSEEHLNGELKAYGMQGWELAAAISYTQGTQRLIFKRELPDEKIPLGTPDPHD